MQIYIEQLFELSTFNQVHKLIIDFESNVYSISSIESGH